MYVELGGVKVQIDEEDFENVKAQSWCLAGKKKNYHRAFIKGTGKAQLLHRYLTNAPLGVIVDHKNRNTFDNRKVNLRFVSNSVNSRNSKLYATNTSGYRGVSRHKRIKLNPWVAVVTEAGKTKHLGYFSTSIEAAKKYDDWMYKHHPEEAKYNLREVVN